MSRYIDVLPLAQNVDKEIASEFLVKDLGEEIEIGYKCCLKNNRNVGCVEQLNGIWLFVSLHLSA